MTNKENFSSIYEREESKKLLFVYSMGKRDITTSKRLLERILNGTSDMYLKDALIIALYITYGRVFGKNFDLPKLELKKLCKDLTENEKDFHKSLIDSRNKIFAHSDASMNNIQICLNEKKDLVAVPSHNTTLIQEYNDLANQLFDKLITSFDAKIKPLLDDLYNQENGYKVNEDKYALLGYSNQFWERFFNKTD